MHFDEQCFFVIPFSAYINNDDGLPTREQVT